jgi:hypothetical protein
MLVGNHIIITHARGQALFNRGDDDIALSLTTGDE